MEYDGPCRDLFYLAFIFLGAAIGLFLNWFRAGMNLRSRNRSVTAGLLLLSCSVAAIAVSLVITDARLFTVPAYYVIAAILAALSILSARFPRAAGFPLILAAGIVFVWIAYTFGQFPQLDGGGCIGSINTASGGQVSAELIPGTQVNFPADNFQCGITVTSFEYARFIPVIGGELRGTITEVLNSGNTLYRDSMFEKGLPKIWLSGFLADGFLGKKNLASVQKTTYEINTDSLYPGSNIRIFYDGQKITLR